MPLSHSIALVVFVSALATANDVTAGFNAYRAAQVMVNKASHSWEWGTAAEALLELYNPELTIFGSNPFPNGQVPKADPGILALAYAKQFINTDSQVLVDDSAVGDPASLGVSAILLGQSDSTYIDAANRQADYILNDAPKLSNGAISQRPDVAEAWADNMAMSMPFLAYLAVQNNDPSLMSETVIQCGLQRDVLKTDEFLNWQHIVGPQSADPGLWSTGNGWAAYGMVRVLHTLQKWSGSSSMTSQAGQLKDWIKEILDGAMQSGLDGGLLRNYLNDNSWFGEISGTALLTAAAYRMAVNDGGIFGQSYIAWADSNRKALSHQQGGDGVFVPAVDPYAWLDRTEYDSGSPEGQAFTVNMYTAYRDCVNAGVCQAPPSATTISEPGIGPIDVMTVLDRPITFSAMPAPTGTFCGPPESCDANSCVGAFNGITKFPTCTGGPLKGCQCEATSTTCGPHQSCDLNGCAGAYDGIAVWPQCTGNFVGCQCSPTDNTCGPHQSCDLNGCAGEYNGIQQWPQCTGNFVGCQCSPTDNTCGPHQSCDLNGCAGAYNGIAVWPECTGNFIGCQCSPTDNTCGPHQSCDLNGCAGSYNGIEVWPQCTGNFVGCQCSPTDNTCGPHQSCDLNGCAGAFPGPQVFPECTGNFVGCECTATDNTCGDRQSCDLNGCAGAYNGIQVWPQCAGNFVGCQCNPTENTCGSPQSCDLNGCAGSFQGLTKFPTCTGNFVGCECSPTDNTCGPHQSCDLNGCAGAFDLSDGKAYCTGNFQGCECIATAKTCGSPQSCDMDSCDGAFAGSVPWPTCTNFFAGCQCSATSNTCGAPQSCGLNGCGGAFDLSNGNAYCTQNFVSCECVANAGTCGAPQSCDLDNCQGKFPGNVPAAECSNFFKGCVCEATSKTCGSPQSCDLNGCAGGFGSDGVARCQGNFQGCECKSTANTCGQAQNCDLNGCAGTFDSSSNTARCRGNFAGCVCIPVASTCGEEQSCSLNGCNGGFNSQGDPVCMGNFYGCPCIPNPIWLPPPPPHGPPPQPSQPSGPSHTGCVVAHCYIQFNIFSGDTMTIQFYSTSQYLFELSNNKAFQSSTSQWTWSNIVDPNGHTWNIQVNGVCSSMSYSNDMQSVEGMVAMAGSHQSHFYSCDFGDHTSQCQEAEASFWDTDCPTGANPSFCDYRATCSPWHGGNPTIVSGGS